jgi:acyl-CoA thioesterase-1
MLSFESSRFSRAREARVDERRNSRRDARTSCRVALLTIGADLEDSRLETGGAADGTAGTARLGGGGAGILPALPMPLGSLTELLRPPALPGPRGMPLTPASCAKHGAGAATQLTNANAKTHDLLNIDHASGYPTKRPACRSRSGQTPGSVAVYYSRLPWLYVPMFIRPIIAALLTLAAIASANAQIVALGASSTAGYGVGAAAAFPAQLEAILRAKGRPMSVSAAGVSGDTTGGMLARLSGAVPAGTKIVILQIAGNDAMKGMSPVAAAANRAEM